MKICKLASELKVDAVLCAGDLYEQERFTPDTVALLERVFRELHPMPVLISPGNHDWYGTSSLYSSASWSDNVHVFTSSGLTAWDRLDGIRIWGFAHRAPSGTPNPLEGFRVDGKAIHIGLFHGSEGSGWSWASRAGTDKQPHAPFSADQIPESGLAHCVIGHYHQRVEGDWHTYGGAPAALSFGEPVDGGAVELVFDDRGQLAERRRCPKVSELCVHGDLELDITGCHDMGAVEMKLDELLAPLSGIGRVTLIGTLSRTIQLDLRVLQSRPGPLAHLSVRTGDLRSDYDLEQVANEPTVRGEFVKAVDAQLLDDDTKRRVILTGLRALDGRDDLEVL